MQFSDTTDAPRQQNSCASLRCHVCLARVNFYAATFLDLYYSSPKLRVSERKSRKSRVPRAVVDIVKFFRGRLKYGIIPPGSYPRCCSSSMNSLILPARNYSIPGEKEREDGLFSPTQVPVRWNTRKRLKFYSPPSIRAPFSVFSYSNCNIGFDRSSCPCTFIWILIRSREIIVEDYMSSRNKFSFKNNSHLLAIQTENSWQTIETVIRCSRGIRLICSL